MNNLWMKECQIWMIFVNTFHENADGVRFKNRLLTPKQTVVEGILFVYALTNTNLAEVQFFLDQTCCRLGDYGHGVTLFKLYQARVSV